MKNILFLSVIITILFVSCAKLPSHQAEWVSLWPVDNAQKHQNEKHKLNYEIGRDSNNIYLHASTTDMGNQIKIMRYGLTVWTDVSGKKKQQKGFTFPKEAGSGGGNREGGDRARGEGGNRPSGSMPGMDSTMTMEQMQGRMLKMMMRRFSSRPKELVEIGFEAKDSSRTFILGKDACDIQADLELDESNTLHYYAIIPIKKLFGDNPPAQLSLSLGFVSGAMDMEMSSGHGGTPPPAGMSGASTRSGGSGAMRMMMQSPELMQSLMEPIDVWFKVVLK